MSHISSAYRLLTTCVYVHVRKGAREVLDRIFISSAKLLLFFARFPIFPIIETSIPYNSAFSNFLPHREGLETWLPI